MSRFTPNAGGLDRDAILFAAGRASARPNRWWQGAVGALIVVQVLTLMLMWPKTAPPAAVPPLHRTLPDAGERDTTSPSESFGPWSLGNLFNKGGNEDFPPPQAVDSLPPGEPPLRAWSTSAELRVD